MHHHHQAERAVSFPLCTRVPVCVRVGCGCGCWAIIGNCLLFSSSLTLGGHRLTTTPCYTRLPGPQSPLLLLPPSSCCVCSCNGSCVESPTPLHSPCVCVSCAEEVVEVTLRSHSCGQARERVTVYSCTSWHGSSVFVLHLSSCLTRNKSYTGDAEEEEEQRLECR